MTLIGHRIRQARERVDPPLSQASLAREVGVSRVSVSQWEKGEIRNLRHENLLRVAKALGVSVHWLLSGAVAEPEAPYGPESDTASVAGEGPVAADPPGAGAGHQNGGAASMQARGCAFVPVVPCVPPEEPSIPAGDVGSLGSSGPVELPVDEQLAAVLSPEAFAFRMPEEAMAPYLRRGDWVLGDPRVAPEPGMWAVARLPDKDGTLTVRRLDPRGWGSDGSRGYALQSLDPTFAMGWMEEGSGLGEIEGVVIEIRRHLVS